MLKPWPLVGPLPLEIFIVWPEVQWPSTLFGVALVFLGYWGHAKSDISWVIKRISSLMAASCIQILNTVPAQTLRLGVHRARMVRHKSWRFKSLLDSHPAKADTCETYTRYTF